MIKQDYMVWLVGVGLSLTLHASLLIQSGAQLGVKNASESVTPLVTRLNFYQPPRAPIESVQKVEPVKPKKIVTKKASKPLKKKIEKKPKLEPKPEPEPVKVEKKLVQATPQSQGQLSNNKPALLMNKKRAYMQELLAHIENFKFYPRSARSRGIEGDIQVLFELMADGSIRALKVAGGRSVLQRATQQAVQKAVPLPLPPLELSVPRKVEFTIQYRLQ